MTRRAIRWIVMLATTLSACSGAAAPDALPAIAPGGFVAGVTNPFFPLVPGTTHTFRGGSGEQAETVVVEVLERTRSVNGVSAMVVRDRVYVAGQLVEDTDDWFAQDSTGNVWYLGEDSKDIENGRVVGTAGSWEWGVDGALPGIIMWADPAAHIGEAYRQEFYAGEAEDWGRVIAAGVSARVAAGEFTGCVRTEDWSALEPGTLERKTYCPQIGVVLEENVRGGERLELMRTTPADRSREPAANR